jgi:hypothetical protein
MKFKWSLLEPGDLGQHRHIYRDRVVIAAAAAMAFVAANSFSLSVSGRSTPRAKPPATGIARDSNGDLYVSSDWGVLRLPNGLSTWVVAGTGLPECRSCRSHDRAKRRKTVCRKAWRRYLAINTAVTFMGGGAG